VLRKKPAMVRSIPGYKSVLADIVDLLEAARRSSARTVNAIMTATYWTVGRSIVEQEQRGEARAGYGEELIEHLSRDLGARFGRGFGRSNLFQMRAFYLAYRSIKVPSTRALANKVQTPSGLSARSNKVQTPSGLSVRSNKVQTPSGLSARALRAAAVAPLFPLPWSHYVRLLSLSNLEARGFYETEALRDGWTGRQLERQIDSQFYERTALSKNKAAMMARGKARKAEDLVTVDEEIKDPFVLEFLDLKDEYSESDLEGALVAKMESFLLELGGAFTFIGRQRRLRIGDEWYSVDLLFFHRRLRCLVVVDLKLGKLTHADAGQMHLYLNYARDHWTMKGENPPVGLILCAQKNAEVARYALQGLPNKVLAAQYRTALPDEHLLADEIKKTRREIERRAPGPRARKSAASKRSKTP
jgi:predicted nuclease of restriction endonuclease-like (RecB) superfamily